MSHLVKGILSFPTIFTPKVPQAGGDAKFSVAVLLAPNDPQVAALRQVQATAGQNQWPSGVPANADYCLQPYDVKYNGKAYYDQRFTGWWVLSLTAKAEDRPAVVNEARQPIIDPAAVFSGCVAWVSFGMSAYTKGTGGVGGWLNGVMLTSEEPPMGRLDGKPSVDQMFAGAGAPAYQAPAAPAYAAPVAPAPVAPAPVAPAPVAPAPAPAPARQMTAAAATTYEEYKKAGWSDELLIQHGLMLPPTVTPSFGQ